MSNLVSTNSGVFGGNTTMFGTPGGQGGAEGFVQTEGDGLFDRGGSFMNTGRGGSGQALLESGGLFGRNQNQYIETPDGFIQVSGGGRGGQNILVQTSNYTYSHMAGDGPFKRGGSTVYRPNNTGAATGAQTVQTGSSTLPSAATPTLVAGSSGPGQTAPAKGKPGQVGGDRSGPVQQAPTQKVPTKVGGDSGPAMPVQQAPTQKVPTKVGGDKGGPVQQAPTQKTFTKVGGDSGPAMPVQAPTQKAPSKVAGDKGGPVQQAPTQKMPSQVAGDKGGPVQQVPTQTFVPSQVAGDKGPGKPTQKFQLPGQVAGDKGGPVQEAPGKAPGKVGGACDTDHTTPVQQEPPMKLMGGGATDAMQGAVAGASGGGATDAMSGVGELLNKLLKMLTDFIAQLGGASGGGAPTQVAPGKEAPGKVGGDQGPGKEAPGKVGGDQGPGQAAPGKVGGDSGPGKPVQASPSQETAHAH